MGCFLGCFGGEKETKERRRRRSGKRSPHRDRLNRTNVSSGIFQSVAIELGQPSLRQITPRLSPLPSLEPPVESVAPQKIPPSLDPPVESVGPEKTPSLDPPVEPVNAPIQPVNPPVEPVNPPVAEIREVKEQRSSGPPRKKVTFDLHVKTYEHPNYSSEDEVQEEPVQEKPKLSPTRTAFPLNHRYQSWYVEEETEEIEEEEEEEEEDYYYSDDEFEELDQIDEIIGIDGLEGNEEESYESFFSLSIDKEKEMNDKNNNGNKNNNTQEVNSPISKNTPVLTDRQVGPRDRGQFVHPVLNPVENLSQWKEIKYEKTERINLNYNSNLEKENKNLDLNNNNNNLIKREISVDASLSTWLVSSENSTVDQGQYANFTSKDERPILGALTVEDVKQSSVNSSPRRSPSRSPSREDAPIIGTVGSYWSTSTGTSCSSRFREDKMAKCR